MCICESAINTVVDECLVVSCVALTRLYPEGLSEDKVARLNPYTLEIARSVLSFTLKENNLKDGLALAQRMVVLFRAFESESSMCKAMLTITIIELSLGDYVKVRHYGVLY